MKKSQNIANDILKDNPGENQVFITEDGQSFFNELKATHHTKRMQFKTDPEVFFREGFEPEDTKELEEDLELTKSENCTLSAVLAQVISLADLNNEVPEVNQETPEAIAAVVSLREKVATLQAEVDANNASVLEVVTDDDTAKLAKEVTEEVEDEKTPGAGQPAKAAKNPK